MLEHEQVIDIKYCDMNNCPDEVSKLVGITKNERKSMVKLVDFVWNKMNYT